MLNSELTSMQSHNPVNTRCCGDPVFSLLSLLVLLILIQKQTKKQKIGNVMLIHLLTTVHFMCEKETTCL